MCVCDQQKHKIANRLPGRDRFPIPGGALRALAGIASQSIEETGAPWWLTFARPQTTYDTRRHITQTASGGGGSRFVCVSDGDDHLRSPQARGPLGQPGTGWPSQYARCFLRTVFEARVFAQRERVTAASSRQLAAGIGEPVRMVPNPAGPFFFATNQPPPPVIGSIFGRYFTRSSLSLSRSSCWCGRASAPTPVFGQLPTFTGHTWMVISVRNGEHES